MKQVSITLALLTNLFLANSILFADGIAIGNLYIREVPPGQSTSATFLTLKNNSDSEIELTKVTGDIAKNIELHEHVHKDGMMKMRQVAKISIPAKGIITLKPGGYHIMLIGLTKKIKSGDKINLTFEFSDNSKQEATAEVKKIMQGMMKSGMGEKKHSGMKMSSNMKAIKKHVNPMPNLMRVYKKMGVQLNLSPEQVAQLDAGIKERSPVIKRLTKSVVKLEAALLGASLNNEPVEKIEQLANQLMNDRLAIIKGKTYCRESVKKILNEKQFQNLIGLYKENPMKSTMKMDKKTKMKAVKTHVNPMPNFMRVYKQLGDQLNLSVEQVVQLDAGIKERSPVIKRLTESVVKLEAAILEASLNNEPVEKIEKLANHLINDRLAIIKGKTYCRESVKKVLSEKQFKKLLNLYQENFI